MAFNPPKTDFIISDLLRPKRDWNGCVKLAAHVLEQALQDAFGPIDVLSQEAREWASRTLAGDLPGNENPYAIGEFVCEILNVDHSALLARLRQPAGKKIRFKQIPSRPKHRISHAKTGKKAKHSPRQDRSCDAAPDIPNENVEIGPLVLAPEEQRVCDQTRILVGSPEPCGQPPAWEEGPECGASNLQCDLRGEDTEQMHEWSEYQHAIYNTIHRDTDTIAVNAVAGSGKTTTLVEAVSRVNDHALVVAFNKHIVQELKRRLGDNHHIVTVHSLGLDALTGACNVRPTVTPFKYHDIAKWACKEVGGYGKLGLELFDAVGMVTDLVDFSRLTLTFPDDPNFQIAASCYALEAPPELLPIVAECLKEGAAEARHDGIIDFTDMIWLPTKWNLQVDKFNHVFGDEVQDWNAAQLALVLASRADGARGLFAGDPAQSIFGFAFAGLDSFNVVRNHTSGIELPLSICYRCPTSHLELAQQLVPHIQPRPNAPAGEIVHTWTDELSDQVLAGDLVLCRYNAPLIRQCIQLVLRGVPSYIRGRDIGGQIRKFIERVKKRDDNYDHFIKTLDLVLFEQHQRLTGRKASQTVHNSLDDKANCAREMYYGAASWFELDHFTSSWFKDGGDGVCLSTVHRAKGLEADNVWILHPETLEKSNDPQERNVRYVALTRAKNKLGFVRGGKS